MSSTISRIGGAIRGTAEFMAEDSFEKFVRNSTLVVMTGIMTWFTVDAIRNVAPAVKESVNEIKNSVAMMIAFMIPLMFIFFVVSVIKALTRIFGGGK